MNSFVALLSHFRGRSGGNGNGPPNRKRADKNSRMAWEGKMRPSRDKTPWPDNFAVFDAEAEDWTRIYCVCHVDEKGTRKIFRSFDEYLDYIFSSEYKSDLVFSHWGGRYDNRFVISEAVRRRYGWNALMSGSLIVVLVVTDDKGRTIKFCDSGRLMPDSVKSIGKTVGLPKLDIDRNQIGSYDHETIVSYCFRDCEIVILGLQGMRRALTKLGCNFGFTLASVATKHIRGTDCLKWYKFYEQVPGQTRADRASLVYSKAMLESDKWCNPAYFGGRTEMFLRGLHKRKLYLYDIRSAYPWAMTKQLPTYFKGFDIAIHRKDGTQNIERSLERCGISEVSIWMPPEIAECYDENGALIKPYPPHLQAFMHPPIPWRDEERIKVVYPVLSNGERGRWTNIELLELWNMGKAHGLKMVIHQQAVFEPVAFLEPFIRAFFKMRMECKERGDEFGAYAMKILMNSIYGKLIETPIKREVFYGTAKYRELVDKHGIEAIERTPVPGVYFLVREEEGGFRHVAAGAWITALARLRLLEGIKKAVAAGANIYYCDTDSLILDKPVLDVGEKLGDFTLEMEIDEAEIYASKAYKLVGVKKGEPVTIYKAKGMPIASNSATDNDFDKAESERRWREYTAPMRGETSTKPTREGITSFLADIRAGRIFPKAEPLQRQMKNGDTKRTHLIGGESVPLIWKERKHAKYRRT